MAKIAELTAALANARTFARPRRSGALAEFEGAGPGFGRRGCGRDAPAG